MPLPPLSSTMRNFCGILLCACALLFTLPAAHAGVVISGTRFVYPAGKKSITFAVRNPSTTTWLIHTKVNQGGAWTGADRPETAQSMFVATPPLFTLKPARENSVRLTFTDGALPDDRESLFTLSVAAIPEGQREGNSVQTAIRSRFKLFYRPAKLPGEPDAAYQALRWSSANGTVTLENPTPWYVTLYQLSLNDKKFADSGLVAPFSTRSFAGCQQVSRCDIRWQAINEYGRILPELTRHVR
ncbi:molecular chaperone [Enterobacter cancerogenus]|uniref:molecular chaperone n=1 Tax=Enterobacter cancerogenus TaxID=69218 RepID=UPI0034D2147B